MWTDGLTGSWTVTPALAGRNVAVKEEQEEEEYGKPKRETVFLSKERDVWGHRDSPQGAERDSHLIRHRTKTNGGGDGIACS